MQTVMPPSGNTLKILGNPRPANGDLRWMTYVLAQPVDEGVLVFHTLTREMLLLTAAEYAAPDGQPELRERWFRVPREMTDKKYADHVRFLLKTMQKRPEHVVNYSIFTTTDCNARCFYCFEMGRSRTPMSTETAHRAAAYIAAHCGGKSVRLAWFGGEPLCNRPVIDLICADLKEHGIAYVSTMMSNGYLFDDETVRRAVTLWNLKQVQITLDGTEEVYNRCKAYIYKDGRSPYQVVMANIGRLLEADVRVSVRLNTDNHNTADLMALADELHARFAKNRNLCVYSHLLFEFGGREPHVRTDADRRQLREKQQRLDEKLEAYGLKTKRGLRREIPLNQCMADSGSALTILPGGELGVCDHYSEDNFVGRLDHEELDEKMVESFRECREATPYCASCAVYPICIRLKKCPLCQQCYSELRERVQQDTLDAMQVTYASWLKEEETAEEENLELC